MNASDFNNFVYQPPAAAFGARRILVKPNLGYPYGPPVTVSMPVLERVIAGLRQASPQAEILVVEGVCHALSADEIAQRLGLSRTGIRFLDADTLPLAIYANPLPEPARFCEFQAPALLREVDCRISVGACKWTLLNGRPLFSGCVKNLYGLLPRSVYRARGAHSRGQLHRPDVWSVLGDVQATLGPLFDGGVVDATSVLVSPDWRPHRGRTVALNRVFWGDSLTAVDDAAISATRQESNPSAPSPP
ncbi:MAG: DUF362 domain-containing protein [Bryobacteraceae bacterium]|nr:DUF362 domain-containing protein [Bryobacteraceae bacterium]